MKRRQLLTASALGITGAALAAADLRSTRAAGALDPQLLKELQACTPADALNRLLEGNGRFARAWVKARSHPSARRRMRTMESIWRDNCQIDPGALAEGQKPFAAILSCADSRVDPAWIFARGSGELFQVRSAGNTAFDDAIASLEYAVLVLGTSLVLVMGHTGCGAVKAAMGNEPLTPLLEQLVQPIRASIASADDLTQAVQSNTRAAARALTARSDSMAQAVESGRLRIRSACFDIKSGKVSIL